MTSPVPAPRPDQRMLRHRAIVINCVDQGFVSGVNFLTVVILARHLPLAMFGVFMVGQTILTLLTAVQNSLVAQPHNILGPQRSGVDYTRLTFVLAVMQLLFSLALAIVLALFGAVLSLRGANMSAQLGFALALTIPPWMGQEFIRRVLYTQNDPSGATLNNFVSYGLQLVGILAVASQFGGVAANATNAVLVLGLSSLIATALGVWQLRRQLAPRVLVTLPERRSLRVFLDSALDTWRLSKWLMAQQLVTWLGTSGQGLLLAALLGPASFGIYRAAYQVVSILNPIRQTAMNHLPSRAARVFAHAGSRGLHTWLKTTSWQLSLPFVACAVIIALAAEPLADLMYGSTASFADLQTIVVGGALAFSLNFARTPLDYAVLVAGGARALFLRSLALMVFVWTAGIALIWRLGIVGAITSEIICAAIAAGLSLRIYAAMRNRSGQPCQLLTEHYSATPPFAGTSQCADQPTRTNATVFSVRHTEGMQL